MTARSSDTAPPMTSIKDAFAAIPFDDDADQVRTWKGLALSSISDMRRYADDELPHRRMVSVEAYEADAVRLATLTTPAPGRDAGSCDAQVQWLEDAARYFEARPTVGEDMAHWANVHNAEMCRKIAVRLSALPVAPVVDEAAEPYLVWSNEHAAWWGPNCCGYNTHISHASRYSRDEAIRICVGARGGREFNQNPSEVPVLLKDAEAFWTEAGLEERYRREYQERLEEER